MPQRSVDAVLDEMYLMILKSSMMISPPTKKKSPYVCDIPWNYGWDSNPSCKECSGLPTISLPERCEIRESNSY